MTIITKPLSEKKGDKLVVPLVENDQFATAPPSDDVESQHNIFILPARARRVSTATTLCLLIVAMLVVSIGIFGGTYVYDQYLRVSTISNGRLKGWAQIPYMNDPSALTEDEDMTVDSSNKLDDSKAFDEALQNMFKSDKYFQEQFEISDDEKYEKINVPDFRDDRSGRFIHDFNTNITCIIDTTANRCFVMPLDRKNILPPKSLFDLIHKMWGDYYKIDTQVIRENMRVVTPPITDLSNIGYYITTECKNRPIYKLEKYVGGVVKRSADLHKEAKYAHFAGKGIIELDLINMEDVIAYEKQLADSH